MLKNIIKDIEALRKEGKTYLSTYTPDVISFLESIKEYEVNDFLREKIIELYDSDEEVNEKLFEVIKSFNTYNYAGNISNHINFNLIKYKKGFFIILKVHRYGDVRANYTEEAVITFYEDKEETHNLFIEALYSIIVYGEVIINGEVFGFNVDPLHEGITILSEERKDFQVFPDGLEEEDIKKAIEEKLKEDEGKEE